MKNDPIVHCAIFPSIGVARVGNSPDEYFIGPEAPGMTPQVTDPEFRYKDRREALKRQAARFRIYATRASGRVEELNLDTPNVEIEWTVHVANTKPAWYQFNNAMDLPSSLAMDAIRRNHYVMPGQRGQLAIDPGAHSISGKKKRGKMLVGRFLNMEDVTLGELRTDEAGRLLFLGGFGVSDSPIASNPIVNFSNNDGWHDDVSDGPVTAKVTIRDGRKRTMIDVEPAWVIVTPPNFAPGTTSITTLYDLCRQVAVEKGWESMPDRPDFGTDIYPILKRFSGLQWVADGMDYLHGWQAELDFLNLTYVAKLANNTKKTEKDRREVFKAFRNPSFERPEPDKLPTMMGDGIDYPNIARSWFAILPTQYEMLRKWAAGDFTNKDWRKKIDEKPKPLDSYPVDEQPHVLTRGALEACLGGPFHPGIEVTWPMRQQRLYAAPYRLRYDGSEIGKLDFGPLLTPDVCMSEDGPLSRNTPGDLTRWMGVPWQSDAASCQNIYVPKDFPLPVWWPSILPVDVLPEFAYRQVMDTSLPAAQRQKFFGFRREWPRGVGDVGYHALGGYVEAMINMVNDWNSLGVIVPRPGPPDHKKLGLPDTIFVETQRAELQDLK